MIHEPRNKRRPLNVIAAALPAFLALLCCVPMGYGDELRLGRGLVLQSSVQMHSPTSRPVGEYTASLTLTVRRAARDLISWHLSMAVRDRSDAIARLVFADWMDEQSLVTLSIVGRNVVIARVVIEKEQATVTEQFLFYRARGGGAVWEVIGARMDLEGPTPAVLIETRDERGVRKVIPVQFQADATKGKWVFDDNLIGAKLYE